jgi:hypothetical protein
MAFYSDHRFKRGQRVVILSSWDTSVRHGQIIAWPKVLGGPWQVKVDTAVRPINISDDFLIAETEENKGWTHRPVDTDYPDLD